MVGVVHTPHATGQGHTGRTGAEGGAEAPGVVAMEVGEEVVLALAGVGEGEAIHEEGRALCVERE